METRLQLSSLEDAQKELLHLKDAEHVQVKNWDVPEICLHCAQTIQYALTGYPVMKPVFIQNTIGRIALRKFFRQGYMTHDLKAHVPGGSKLDSSLSTAESIQRLMDSIEEFKNYTGALKPHLLFGHLSKTEYDRYFAMHIADHLSELDY